MMERQPQRETRTARYWLPLAPGIICMVMVANLQYGWSLFVNPINLKTQWGRAEIQFAFTIFIIASTWLMPVAGYLADRLSARSVAMAGGVLVGISWCVNAYAESLAVLYVSAAIGGAGTCAVFGACIGHALKCFPAQRGLAVGLIAAGFGTVSAATVLPIHSVIQAFGYENAFLYFGLAQGAIVFAAAALLAPPIAADIRADRSEPLNKSRNYGPLEILCTPVFWVMYLMFVLVTVAGLMAIGQLAVIAKEYKVANVPVSLFDLTLPALAFALAIDRVFSGLARPFFGWVSDHLGRETTMGIAFAIEAAAIVALARFGHEPGWFVVLTGVIFFAWGEIYSLFPATTADSFGEKHAATHAGLVYTAKGAGALIVMSFSATLLPATEWHIAFYCAAGINAMAAVLALLVLKPLRARQAALDRAFLASTASTAPA